MKDAGTLDLARAAIAKRRAPGQIAPSKYLPGVPRQVHSAGGKVSFLAGNHPLVPDVLYHGTARDVRSFDPEAKRSYDIDPTNPDETDTGWFGKGHYFTDKPVVASHYANEGAKRQGGQGANIIPVHVSLKNPFVVNMRGYESGAQSLDQALSRAGVPMHPRGWRKPSEQTAALMKMGHDGVIATREGEPKEYVVFKPEQVKSAISAREFDPENPDMTKAEGGAITKGDGGGITAYHGSPHDFDAFDINQIGTGEGAQAYGHGLYFAGNEDVARQYRNRVSSDKGAFDIINTKTGKRITEETPGYDTIYNAMKSYGSDFRSGDKSHFIENWKRWSDHHEKNTIPEYEAHGGLGDEVSRMKKQVLDWRAAAELMPYAKMRPRGHMYKVNLNVGPHELLDWDAPLSQQPAWQRVRQHWDNTKGDPDIIADRLGLDENSTGQDLHKALSGPNQINASIALSEAGIKGIRYLDAGSRGYTGKPTYNYVMFHHDPVKIVDKYAYGGDVDNKPIDLNVERARKNVASGDLPQHVQNTFDSMAERNRAQLAAHQEAMQAGAFDDTRIGDEYRAPDGSTFKITNHFMMPANRWGGREPPSMVYQGHVPMVSTVYTDPKMKGFDMNRAVEHVRQMERIGGPLRVAKAGGGGVGDNDDAPVDLGVHRFHQKFMGKMKSTMNDMVDAHQKALQAGVFDGYEVGDKLQGQVGPLTVKARYMAKWKPGGPDESIIRRMGQIPTLMDHNGVTYYPMVRLTDADGGEGDYALDAVRGYPKFTGLRVAKKNGGGLKLYSKAARIIRGLAKPEDNAEEMVRIALEKGAKKAELQHADVAPGMASRDQVADYIEAVQPRIGVQKRGEGIGLTDQERDELGYLRSMMPHQRTPENDQRIAELNEKKFSSPQYEQYQLPGGENYREHVLTLDSHSHNDPYYARSHWGNTPNPLAHIRMSDRTVMPPHEEMRGYLDRVMKHGKGIDGAVEDGILSPQEGATLARHFGADYSPLYTAPGIEKKILHVEELQSDWNNDARRKGFRTGTEQEDYQKYVDKMRDDAVAGIDPTASPMIRQALRQKYNTIDPYMLAIKIGRQSEHNEMARRASNAGMGVPQAPYVNPKSDDWAELAMKHILHEAAQGGYDGITFTPDAEQSKRWGGTEFKDMYDKKFPGITARLVKQHDPSINPSTMQITQGVQGPMIPLTEQARRGILENGFSSFKKGGYVR